MHKSLQLMIEVVGMGAASFFACKWYQYGNISHHNCHHIKNTVPTLFIHGYAGNRLSSGPMINRFEKNGWGTKTCVIIVRSKKRLKVKGDPTVPGCFIQILFDENRLSVIKQVHWLWRVMGMLKEKYHVPKVNLVAHSMGAVTVLRYLSNHSKNNTHLPKVEKVVTLGAPFNDTDPGKGSKHIESHLLTKKGPLFETLLYQAMRKHHFLVDEDIGFLNIAGDLDNGSHSDGEVATSSALSLRYLVKNCKQYQEYVIHGFGGSHSLLHENLQVDNLIGKFLFFNS